MIKANKQNGESIKKYVPEAYQAHAEKQRKSELAALEDKLKAAKLEAQKKSGAAGSAGTTLLADAGNSTESDSVADLEGMIKANKQNAEAIKKYVPEAYQAHAEKQRKSELAALEDKLKAAKLE